MLTELEELTEFYKREDLELYTTWVTQQSYDIREASTFLRRHLIEDYRHLGSVAPIANYFGLFVYRKETEEFRSLK